MEYLVESMSVEAFLNVRRCHCKLLIVNEFTGFCKAKKKFYYGFKLHMITTPKGHPVAFIIRPASVADVTALKIVEIPLPFGSIVYEDKAYTSYLFEDELLEFEGIKLTPGRRANLSRQHSGCVRYLQSVLRKKIGTTFSLIVRVFSRKIHAVTKAGFLLKLAVFVVSFSFSRLL